MHHMGNVHSTSRLFLKTSTVWDNSLASTTFVNVAVASFKSTYPSLFLSNTTKVSECSLIFSLLNFAYVESAPALTRASTAATCPSLAAAKTGVQPTYLKCLPHCRCTARFTSAPALTRASIKGTFPRKAASQRTVRPSNCELHQSILHRHTLTFSPTHAQTKIATHMG